MNKNNLISLFVTFGFLGKAKYFPGTIGSLGGLLAGATIIKILGHNIFISCFFILTLISFFAVEEYLKCSKSIDPQEVVIDEVLGQWIAIAFIPFNFEAFLLAFILFRFFDIFKLFPINKIEKIKGFIGVIGDDLLAGIYTAIIITILSSYGFI
jgi:phosphatidylglycerophosphatase A